MEVDYTDPASMASRKRERLDSTSFKSRDQSDDESSASSDAWSDLEHDNWLSQPDAASQAARLQERGGRTMRYARAVTPEKIDSKTPLKEDNVGMKMLKLMGWTPGGGLGVKGLGRAEPIPLPDMMNGLGLGKANIETRMLSEAINQGPRVLESQRIAIETEVERQAREAKVATKAEVTAFVNESLSKFFCDICSKPYANVAQWEEHLQSYGHNHAKRKKEVAMQQRSIKNNSDEINRRREKEKKREQKELERLMKAVGGPAGTASGSGTNAPANAAPLSAPAKAPIAPPLTEKKKGGFFKVASSAPSQPPPPPSVYESLPPPPPPPPAEEPPPPPPIRAAPKFTSSKSSNLAATWHAPPTILPAALTQSQARTANASASASASSSSSSRFAHTWKPTTAPALHPLLAGDTGGNSSQERKQAASSASSPPPRGKDSNKDLRNDYYRREDDRPKSEYELPTAASTYNTTRAPKGMSFVGATATATRPSSNTSGGTLSAARPGAMSLAGSGAQKKKPMNMMNDEEEDEGDEGGMPLPAGRPKARMPVGGAPKTQIGFGSINRQ